MNNIYDELDPDNLPKYVPTTVKETYTKARNIIKLDLHLCRHCFYNIATCKSKTIKLGDSLGRDNVYSCQSFTQNPKK